MKSNQPMGVSGAIKARTRSFEDEQKQKIVQVCQSDMKYADTLAYIENEIAQSKKMSNFRYQIRCWRSDGAYQLNRAITEIFGVAKAAANQQVWRSLEKIAKSLSLMIPRSICLM